VAESGPLPAGITFTAGANGTATLSGTPTTVGSPTFTITATNRTGTVSQIFTLTVDKAPAITSAGSYTAKVGAAFSFKVTTVGAPVPTLTRTGALPAGVAFTAAGGGATIAGTPSAAVVFTLSITATNTAGVTTQRFTLTVDKAPAITSAGAYTAKVGLLFSFKVTTTGTPAPMLTEIGSLPAGITFVAGPDGTATIAGKATAATAGTGVGLSIRATNPAGTVTQSFKLTVDQ